MAFYGVFTPALAKRSKSFSLIDCVSVDVDRMQRNFKPMQKKVEAWQRCKLTNVTGKVVIYGAFLEGPHQRFQGPRSGSPVQGDCKLADLLSQLPP